MQKRYIHLVNEWICIALLEGFGHTLGVSIPILSESTHTRVDNNAVFNMSCYWPDVVIIMRTWALADEDHKGVLHYSYKHIKPEYYKWEDNPFFIPVSAMHHGLTNLAIPHFCWILFLTINFHVVMVAAVGRLRMHSKIPWTQLARMGWWAIIIKPGSPPHSFFTRAWIIYSCEEEVEHELWKSSSTAVSVRHCRI